ncbi:hypothetical protein L6R49_26040 [Myxococcota bacterium]|nr:hypothetical protein [Myxococcota bacterium]
MTPPDLNLPPPPDLTPALYAPLADARPLPGWDERIARLSIAEARSRPGAFTPLTVDVKLGLGFNAFSGGPLGLALSFFSWVGLNGAVDVGVYQHKSFSVGVGLEGFNDRPFLTERLGEWALNTLGDLSGRAAGDWDITMWHRGFAGRVTLHIDPNQDGQSPRLGLDPYVVGVLGPRWSRSAISYVSESLGQGSAEYREKGLRGGVGLGLNGVHESGVLGAVELRYLAGISFQTSSAVNVTNAQGEPLVVWEQQRWERPPRGFSWGFSVGYRF